MRGGQAEVVALSVFNRPLSPAEQHPVAARVLRTTEAQVALQRTDDRTEALREFVWGSLAWGSLVDRWLSRLRDLVSITSLAGDFPGRL